MSSPRPSRDVGFCRQNSCLCGIVVAALVVRLALWLCFADYPVINSEGKNLYSPLAVNLVRSGEFALVPGEPSSDRPPLYPLFLAGVYELFGSENFSSVRLAQAGLSLITLILLYQLACQIYCRRVGLYLAACYAFYPALLGYNTLLRSEALFTFFLCAACYALVLLVQEARWTWAVLAGFLLGLAALTRVVIWPFPFLLTACLLLPWYRSQVRPRYAFCLLLTFLLTIAPWTIRCSLVEKTWVVGDSRSIGNVMQGNHRYTELTRPWDEAGLPYEQSPYHFLVSTYPNFDELSQGQQTWLAFRAGIQFMWENPGLTLKRDTIKLLQYWQLDREIPGMLWQGELAKSSPLAFLLISCAIVGAYAVAMMVGTFGLFLAPPTDRRIHALLVLVIVYFWGVHTLSFAHSRYHIPIMPLVLAYAASGLVNLRDIWRRRGERAFRWALALNGILIASWLVDLLADPERYFKVLSQAGPGP